MKKISLLILLCTVVPVLAATDRTKSLVQKPALSDDSTRVELVKSILFSQVNRKEAPEYDKEWRQFNYSDDPMSITKGWELIGYMPHKKSVDISTSPVSIGYETLDRDTFDPKLTFDYLAECGVKYARCQTGWWKCERTKGKYDFLWLDEVVDSLSKKGISTWFSLGFGHPEYTPCDYFDKQFESAKASGKMVPGWARGWVGESPWYAGDQAMQGWLKYVRALAKHFKGRVQVWEIWNEPETFWRQNYKRAGGDILDDVKAAKDFAAFFKITASEIRKVIPDAKCSFNLTERSSIWHLTLAKEGIAEVADIYNFHDYKRYPEDNLRASFEQLQTLFKRKDGTSLDIWCGESGRASGKSNVFAFPTEYAQAKFITRRIVSDVALGAKVTNIFTVTDFLSYYEDGRDQYYGIWNARENKPKLSYYSLQSMCYIFDGLEKAPEYYFYFTSPTSAISFSSISQYSNVEVAQFKKGNIPVIAFWQKEHVDINATPIRGMFRYVTDAPSLLPHPIIIDPVRGQVWDVSSTVGYYKRGIEELEVWAYDYPLFLTDISFFINNEN